MPTSGYFDPYAADQDVIKRRRAVAEALLASSQQPLAAMPSGAIASRRSPLEGVAQVAKAYMGKQGMERADVDTKDLGGRQREDVARAMSEYTAATGGTPARSEQIVDEQAMGGEGASATITAPGAPATPDARRVAIARAMMSPNPQLQMLAKIELDNLNRSELHDRPGGAALLGAQTAQRGQDIGANTALAGQGVTTRGQDIGAQTALAGQNVTARGQDIGASTAVRGQDIGANTALAGQRVAARGQDIGANTALAGQNVTARGQDIGAQTAAVGQGVTMRGQDLTAGTAAAGQAAAANKPREAQVTQKIGVDTTRDAITQYRDVLKNFGITDIANPSARAQMGTVYNNMLLQAKEAYRLGVLSGPDLRMLESVVTNPMSIKGFTTKKAALDAQAAKLDEIMGRIGNIATGAPAGGTASPSDMATAGWQVRVKP